MLESKKEVLGWHQVNFVLKMLHFASPTILVSIFPPKILTNKYQQLGKKNKKNNDEIMLHLAPFELPTIFYSHKKPNISPARSNGE